MYKLLLFIPLLACSSALATPCRDELVAKLDRLPGLQILIRELVEDPAIPSSLRRIISEALSNPEVDVRRLTREVRQEFGIPEDFEAATLSSPAFVIAPSVEGASANEAATAGLRARGTRLFNVFVQDRPLTRLKNDLILFVHELSHVRFDLVLTRMIARMEGRVPPSLLRRTSTGKYVIQAQFYDFLSERYAAQTEWCVLKAAYGKYFAEPFWLYEGVLGEPDSVVHRAISGSILKRYEITDPEIVALRDRSVSSILLGSD